MKNYDTYNYTIAQHYAVAMVNSDESGMEDEDIKLLDAFSDALLKRHGNAHIIIEPNDQEAKFTHCDVCSLMADCLDVIVMVEKVSKWKI